MQARFTHCDTDVDEHEQLEEIPVAAKAAVGADDVPVLATTVGPLGSVRVLRSRSQAGGLGPAAAAGHVGQRRDGRGLEQDARAQVLLRRHAAQPTTGPAGGRRPGRPGSGSWRVAEATLTCAPTQTRPGTAWCRQGDPLGSWPHFLLLPRSSTVASMLPMNPPRELCFWPRRGGCELAVPSRCMSAPSSTLGAVEAGGSVRSVSPDICIVSWDGGRGETQGIMRVRNAIGLRDGGHVHSPSDKKKICYSHPARGKVICRRRAADRREQGPVTCMTITARPGTDQVRRALAGHRCTFLTSWHAAGRPPIPGSRRHWNAPRALTPVQTMTGALKKRPSSAPP